MQRVGRWTGCLLAGLCAVGGCGGDDSVEVGAGGSAVLGHEAGPRADSSGSGGTGGSTASTDSSAGGASSVAMPDVSMGDAAAGGEARAADSSSESASDASSDSSSDASGETIAEAGTSDDVIADGTDDAPPVSKICAKECVTAVDCSGGSSVYKPICEPTSHRCVSCIDDLPCFGGASGWIKPCAADGDCTPTYGDYCVDIGGSGFCAFDSTKIGTSSCFGNASSYTIKKHSGSEAGSEPETGSESGSETVSVCAKLTTTCDPLRGRCEAPCTITCGADGGGCTSTCTVTRGGKICNATTKRCGCASDGDCASPSSHCNLVTLQCECASLNDCAPDGGGALVCK